MISSSTDKSGRISDKGPGVYFDLVYEGKGSIRSPGRSYYFVAKPVYLGLGSLGSLLGSTQLNKSSNY